VQRTIEEAQERIEELERLISKTRHDIRGALSPARLWADRLSADPDPKAQRAGQFIDRAIQRVIDLLIATGDVVPSRQAGRAVPGTDIREQE
jgi:transcription elongation GreA/GreB family factor